MAATGRIPRGIAGFEGPSATPAGTSDGRTQRRDRNRDAVVEAILALFRDGDLDPSSDAIAERANVSPRSVFRYFDDIDDLSQAAIRRQQHDVGHLLAVAASPGDRFATKVQAFVDQRMVLFQTVEPVALVSRLRAPFQQVVAENLTQGRAFLRSQIATLFAPELATVRPGPRALRLAAADVASSFEAFVLLRNDLQFDTARAAATMLQSLTSILSP